MTYPALPNLAKWRGPCPAGTVTRREVGWRAAQRPGTDTMIRACSATPPVRPSRTSWPAVYGSRGSSSPNRPSTGPTPVARPVSTGAAGRCGVLRSASRSDDRRRARLHGAASRPAAALSRVQQGDAHLPPDPRAATSLSQELPCARLILVRLRSGFLPVCPLPLPGASTAPLPQCFPCKTAPSPSRPGPEAPLRTATPPLRRASSRLHPHSSSHPAAVSSN